MRLLEHPLYKKEIAAVGELPLPWERFAGCSVWVSGATGLIGHFLVDVLMYQNKMHNRNCGIYALGRNEEKARNTFEEYWKDPLFHFSRWDFRQAPEVQQADYILHLASTTHPKAYATEPIDTIMLNVEGLCHLLEAACKTDSSRFLFASSCEIYGEPVDNLSSFSENSYGYINCNTLRAGYPESKRTGEALCQAYLAAKGIDVVIPRLSRTFGPTMLPTDTKAHAQFLQKGVEKEDIVLKSEGKQLYSYAHVADTVSGIFYCLLLGKKGEAYNVTSGAIHLKDLAQTIADYAGTQVVFQLPEEVEKSGYSVVKQSVLDTTKLESLGWKPLFTIPDGVRETVRILSDIKNHK